MSKPFDVRDYERLIQWWLTSRGLIRRHDVDDLRQVARMALVRAHESHDPEKGAWTTYACRWLRGRVGRHVELNCGPVHVPIYTQYRRRRAGEKATPTVLPMDAPARPFGGTLGETLAAPEQDLGEELDTHAQLESIMAKSKLTERERWVITQRAVDRTHKEIGAELGLTRGRIQQIEILALRKLRRAAGVSQSQHSIADTTKGTRKRRTNAA